MLASEYQGWLKRASQNVEGALGVELATPSRRVVTEDYIRAAMLRGFVLSYPQGAGQVEREAIVQWSDAKCIEGHSISGGGRPLQHDVGLNPEPDSDNDKGAAVELKWLTHTDTSRVAQDVWKLALSRTSDPEGSALRTYLVLGGTMDAIAGTMTGLRNIGCPLRWSPAGQGKDWPQPSTLNLCRMLETNKGASALRTLLSRGNHVRMPPPCWTKFRASLRWRWLRRIDDFRDSDSTAWRLLVWELDHRTIGEDKFEWSAVLPKAAIACSESA
jgi:hypothetical protein